MLVGEPSDWASDWTRSESTGAGVGHGWRTQRSGQEPGSGLWAEVKPAVPMGLEGRMEVLPFGGSAGRASVVSRPLRTPSGSSESVGRLQPRGWE